MEDVLSQADAHESSDSWWLPEEQAAKELLVGLGHHAPLGDDDVPLALRMWFRSLSGDSELSRTCKLYPLGFVEKWRDVCGNTNVYRTLTVYDKRHRPVAVGPFLVDIDNEQGELEDTRDVAQEVVDLLAGHWGVDATDLRVFFSGRKGLNVEVRPASLGIVGPVEAQLRSSSRVLDEIIGTLRAHKTMSECWQTNRVSPGGTFIDRVYGGWYEEPRLKMPYIRLHGSSNGWVANDGVTHARRKDRIDLDELRDCSASEIVAKAERAHG